MPSEVNHSNIPNRWNSQLPTILGSLLEPKASRCLGTLPAPFHGTNGSRPRHARWKTPSPATHIAPFGVSSRRKLPGSHSKMATQTGQMTRRADWTREITQNFICTAKGIHLQPLSAKISIGTKPLSGALDSTRLEKFDPHGKK